MQVFDPQDPEETWSEAAAATVVGLAAFGFLTLLHGAIKLIAWALS